MFRFAFVNGAAEREYKTLPAWVQDEFGKSLRQLQFGELPTLAITHLSDSVAAGVIELKINGRPAFRCVYIAKYIETVIVLHSFIKTTNKIDHQAMRTVLARYQELMQALRH
jgi:phage-related protein